VNETLTIRHVWSDPACEIQLWLAAQKGHESGMQYVRLIATEDAEDVLDLLREDLARIELPADKVADVTAALADAVAALEAEEL
jgi:hypothetical protein